MINGQRMRSKPPRMRLPVLVSLTIWIWSTALPPVLLFLYGTYCGAVSNVAILWFAVAALFWSIFVATRAKVGLVRHIRTLSTLVYSASAEDYTIKGTHAREPGELGELYRQINTLIGNLENGRHIEQELLGMLRKVVDQIDVAIIACDAYDKIRLVNPFAAKLLGAPAAELIERPVTETALAGLSIGTEPRVLEFRFPGADSRWQISQQLYRHCGRPARIVFVVDLHQALVDEETRVWRRLIRVISHEVNNSLTPIMSLCQTLDTILSRKEENPPSEVFRDGLGLIGERAKGLKEFISAYARVARIPEAQKVVVPVSRLVERMQGIFASDSLKCDMAQADFCLFCDPVHIEHVLINLIKNAIDANQGSSEPVQLSCAVVDGQCRFEIVDNGTGIVNPDNLFVPFYTTKPGGAGIGLVLCRDIISKHFGQVTLENRSNRRGAIACVTLPLPPPA